MSLMSMRRKMASKKTITIILWVLIVVFLAGIALWSVPNRNLFGPTGNTTHYNGPGADALAFTVGGDNVTVGEVFDAYNTMLAKSQAPRNVESVTSTREAALQNLILRKISEKAIKSFNAAVDDNYLRSLANDYALIQMADFRKQAEDAYAKQSQPGTAPADKKKTKSVDALLQENLANYMHQNGVTDVSNVTPESFTSWFVDQFLMSDQHDMLADNGIVSLLGEQVIKSLPVDPLSEAFVRKVNTQEVRGRYIFVAAKTPTPEGLKEASDNATAAYNKVLKDPKNFSQIAMASSSDFSGRAGGDLQWVKGNTSYVAPMTEYLLFSTQPGQMSKVVQITGSSPGGGQPQVGYGFVIVDQVRDLQDLKDMNFDRDKKILIAKSKQRLSYSLGSGFQQYLRASTIVVAKRHEIQVYLDDLNNEFIKADDERKLALAQDANLPDDVRASFGYRLANTTIDPQQRVEYYKEALPYAGDQTAQLHMKLGDTYLAVKDTKDATEQYANALSMAEITSDYTMVTQIQQAYQKLGNVDGMKDIASWLIKNPKPKTPPMGGMSGMGGMPMSAPAGN